MGCFFFFISTGVLSMFIFTIFGIFLRIFGTWLYDIKYSYLIQIICTQVYLIHKYNHSILRGPGSLVNKEVLCIPQNSRVEGSQPEAVLYYTLDNSFEGVLPLCKRFSQRIPSPANRVDKIKNKIKMTMQLMVIPT